VGYEFTRVVEAVGEQVGSFGAECSAHCDCAREASDAAANASIQGRQVMPCCIHTHTQGLWGATFVLEMTFVCAPHVCCVQVKQLQPGDRVMSPFTTSCGSCFPCSKGLTCRCSHAQGARCFGWVGEGAAAPDHGLQGSQAQYVRVPLADGTLVKVGEVQNY
jgi:hypothetical protein